MKDYSKVVLKQLLLLGAFAAAFGYVEGAVAHYLRIHFYPEGFGVNLQLKAIDTHTLLIEVGRELATMVMLVTAAALSKGSGARKFANFVYIFGIWDIFYYISLYVFEGWPVSLITWDVLFLVPVPWFGPVLSPVLLSVIGIAWAVFVNIFEEKNKKVKFNYKITGLLAAGLVISLVSFVIDSPADTFPEKYHWELFSLSIAVILASFGWFLYVNRKNR